MHLRQMQAWLFRLLDRFAVVVEVDIQQVGHKVHIDLEGVRIGLEVVHIDLEVVHIDLGVGHIDLVVVHTGDFVHLHLNTLQYELSHFGHVFQLSVLVLIVKDVEFWDQYVDVDHKIVVHGWDQPVVYVLAIGNC